MTGVPGESGPTLIVISSFCFSDSVGGSRRAFLGNCLDSDRGGVEGVVGEEGEEEG